MSNLEEGKFEYPELISLEELKDLGGSPLEGESGTVTTYYKLKNGIYEPYYEKNSSGERLPVKNYTLRRILS